MNNYKGFSLVEMMIVVGLSVIAFAASSTFLIQMNKMIKRLENKQELATLVNDVQAITSSKTTCNNALVANQAFDLNLADDSSRDSDGNIVIANNQGMNFRLRLGSGAVLATGSSNFIEGYGLKTNLFKLFNAQPAGTLGTDAIYKVELVGAFSGKVGSTETPYAPRSMSHFFIQTNSSNVIVGCFNFNPNDPQSITDLKETICTDFGGTFDSATGACQGLANVNVGSCPSGEVMQGIDDQSGAPICVSQATSTTTTIVSNNSGNTGNSAPANGRWRQVSSRYVQASLGVITSPGVGGNCPGRPRGGGTCSPRGLACDARGNSATLGQIQLIRWRCE